MRARVTSSVVLATATLVTGVMMALSSPASAAPDGGATADCGAYCPTNVGAPSGNGSGTGNATGRPDAGTVGNADSMNPPGQAPDGTDDNNGYECDDNSGIGQTNPAHTGCAPASPPPCPEK